MKDNILYHLRGENTCSTTSRRSSEQLIECQRIIQSYVKEFGDLTLNSLKIESECEKKMQKPTAVDSENVRLYGNEPSHFPQQSQFSTSSKDAFMWPQYWGSCRWCSMENGRVLLHSPGNNERNHVRPEQLLLMGRNRLLGEKYPASEFRGQLTKHPFEASKCTYFVDKPVFAFYAIPWHFGHFIVDVLEPLYHTVMSALGFIDTDVFIFLGALSGEIQSQFDILLHDLYSDTPFTLLRQFTQHPVFTVSALEMLPGRVCFTEGLYLELDVSFAHYLHGYDFYPSSFIQHNRTADKKLQRKYANFRNFIRESVGLKASLEPPHTNGAFVFDMGSKTSILNVIFIKRLNTRKILNRSPVFRCIQETTGSFEFFFNHTSVSEMVLEKKSFSEQIKVFSNTSVFIAQFGSAVHNTMFLQPGAALLLIMSPGCCENAWMYSNQAVLNRIHVFVYCEHAYPGIAQFKWVNKGWKEGPVRYRNSPHTVEDIATFRLLLEEAIYAQISQICLHYPPIPVMLFGEKEAAQVEINTLAWVSLEYRILYPNSPVLFPHVYTTLPPSKLMQKFPNLAVCVSIDGGSSTSGSCFDANFFGSLSHLYVPTDTDSLLVYAWLQDNATGSAVSDSFTILPLGFGGQGVHFHHELLCKHMPHKDKTLSLEVEFKGKTLYLELVFADEGIMQQIIATFCRKNGFDLMECGLLSEILYVQLGQKLYGMKNCLLGF